MFDVKLVLEAGLLEPSWRRPKYLPTKSPPAYRRFIRAGIRELKVGSLFEAISFGIVAALADQNVRSVLQNLSANIIWAIGASGVRGIIQRKLQSLEETHRRHRLDPCEIGANLRDVFMAFLENNGGKQSEIHFKYCSPRQETMEIIIMIK